MAGKGKYAALKASGKLLKFEEEPEFQQKVDAAKKELNLAHMTRATIASEYADLKNEKAELDEKIRALNVKLAACEQVVIAQLEDADETSFSCDVGTMFLQDEPYARCVDRRLLFEWIKKTRQGDLLSVNHQTLNAVVKERLLDGRDLPPGVQVWMCTSARLRRA